MLYYTMFYLLCTDRARALWVRTNGVNTDGAAAKVVKSAGLEKGMPWQFRESKVNRSTQQIRQKSQKCSGPISADPVCPFPSSGDLHLAW